MSRMLDSQEASRRLGVKVTTLYAYVSRGLLEAHRAEDGRRSLFALDDVEDLARRARGGRTVETRLATVTTAVTQIRPDGPFYRGRSACALAQSATFEDVAAWLWRVEPEGEAGWRPARLPRRPALRIGDALCWSVVMAGASDRLRPDLRPEGVIRVARRIIASAITALPGTPDEKGDREEQLVGPLAARLARRLHAEPDPALTRAIDAALVLLADHELATSAVAVRVASSTRADLYDAMLAGLGTMGGPLHGGASELTYAMLAQARRETIEAALSATLRWQHALPGFGHPVYQDGDPRFATLMTFVERLGSAEDRRLLGDVLELAAERGILNPNVDFALAALMWAGGLAPDAGRAIFSVARMAGWTAHYLEELEERPLRFRARAVYASSA